jgi:hypothetical protein
MDRMLEMLNTQHMSALRDVDFMRMAVFAVATGSASPAKAAIFYQHTELKERVPQHSHILLETLRLLRVAMYYKSRDFSKEQRAQYTHIFKPLHEDIVVGAHRIE